MPIAGNRNIVGDAADDVLGNPTHAEVTVLVVILLGMAAGADVMSDFGPGCFPGIAEAQPFVGLLNLPAVLYFLVEEPELVADAVADGGNVQRGERLHVAGGKAAQSAVAQTGLGLVIQELVEALAEILQRRFDGLTNVVNIEQVAAQAAGR